MRPRESINVPIKVDLILEYTHKLYSAAYSPFGYEYMGSPSLQLCQHTPFCVYTSFFRGLYSSVYSVPFNGLLDVFSVFT